MLGIPLTKAVVEKKVDLRIGPAIESLESTRANGKANTNEFALVDADNVNYQQYYELRHSFSEREWSLVTLDNVLWIGIVKDETVTDAYTVALREITKKVVSDPPVEHVLLPLANRRMVLARIRRRR